MVYISSSVKFATCVVKDVTGKKKNSMRWVSQQSYCDVGDSLCI